MADKREPYSLTSPAQATDRGMESGLHSRRIPDPDRRAPQCPRPWTHRRLHPVAGV